MQSYEDADVVTPSLAPETETTEATETEQTTDTEDTTQGE